MKMKKLILLSLTLGLTFPGAHLLAGGPEDEKRTITDAADNQENNNNAQEAKSDNTTDLFSLLSDEELLAILSELNIEDLYNASLINRRSAGLIINDVIKKKFTPREIEVIKNCWAELNKLQRSSDYELAQHYSFDVEAARVCEFELAFERVVHPYSHADSFRFKDAPENLKRVILSKFLRYTSKLKANFAIDIEKRTFWVKYLTMHGETSFKW